MCCIYLINISRLSWVVLLKYYCQHKKCGRARDACTVPFLRLCDKNTSSHPQRSTERQRQKEGPSSHPAPATPRPLTRAISTSKVPFSNTRRKTGTQCQVTTQIKDTLPGPAAQESHQPRCEIHHKGKAGTPFKLWRRPCCVQGHGHLTGYRGRAFWDCTRLTMARLGEEAKRGKGEIWGKKGQLHENSWLTSTSAQPCPAPG